MTIDFGPSFEGLQSLIQAQYIPTNTPSLDPLIIDLNGGPLMESVVNNTLARLKYRLERSGLGNEIHMLFIGPKESLSILADYHFVESFIGRNLTEAYLLTWSAAGQDLITPPDNPDDPVTTLKPISWDEYLLRRVRGEDLKIHVRSPWAQAKFVNIGQNSD